MENIVSAHKADVPLKAHKADGQHFSLGMRCFWLITALQLLSESISECSQLLDLCTTPLLALQVSNEQKQPNSLAGSHAPSPLSPLAPSRCPFSISIGSSAFFRACGRALQEPQHGGADRLDARPVAAVDQRRGMRGARADQLVGVRILRRRCFQKKKDQTQAEHGTGIYWY